MPDGMPKPEKRRGFTPRDVAAVFIKNDGRCAKCSQKVKLGEYAIDHIQALDHLGRHELENWQLLCSPCHIVKTKRDVQASAKGRRLRGEVGQGPKKKIQSRGFAKQTPIDCGLEKRHALGMQSSRTISLDPRGAANFGGLKKKDGVKFDWKRGRYVKA